MSVTFFILNIGVPTIVSFNKLQNSRTNEDELIKKNKIESAIQIASLNMIYLRFVPARFLLNLSLSELFNLTLKVSILLLKFNSITKQLQNCL